MAKPFTTKRILLTPQTWNVLLDVSDLHYPRAIILKGRMGASLIEVKLTQKECKHLSEFFAMQAKRMGGKK
jgi:hypothetical protein